MTDDKPGGIPLEFERDILHLRDIPNIQSLDIPAIDYVVPGMIARSTITLWTGADGTAKTYLVTAMSIAIASGGVFLGRRCQQASVLYLDYENPSFAIRDRLDVMTNEHAVPDLYVWGTWLQKQPPQIGSPLLLSIAKESKPVMIVDPFRYSHSAEENDSTAMMGVMQQLRYCAIAGCAVIVLHHPAKSEGSTGRGSSAIKGAVDVAFLQELNEESGLITLKCIKNRFGETHPVTIRPNFDAGTFEVTDSPQFTQRANDMDKLRKIITEQPGQSQNSICKAAGMMKARVGGLLKEGLDTYWIAQPGPNRAICYYPDGWFPNLRTTARTTEPPARSQPRSRTAIPCRPARSAIATRSAKNPTGRSSARAAGAEQRPIRRRPLLRHCPDRILKGDQHERMRTSISRQSSRPVCARVPEDHCGDAMRHLDAGGGGLSGRTLRRHGRRA